MYITVALADDHQLVRRGIRLLLEELQAFEVVLEASNGKQLIDGLNTLEQLPNMVLIDVHMPVMDGVETVQILNKKYPKLALVALSVSNDLKVVRDMIKAGANAYLNKDADPEEVRHVLMEVQDKGFYYDQKVIESLSVAEEEEPDPRVFGSGKAKALREMTKLLTEREIAFLRLCCSELAYKEIAAAMGLSPYTIEGYRSSICEKLKICSRTGLVLFAIQAGISTAPVK